MRRSITFQEIYVQTEQLEDCVPSQQLRLLAAVEVIKQARKQKASKVAFVRQDLDKVFASMKRLGVLG